MICPHCGKPATAIEGRCSACNGVLELGARPQAATGALTPFPAGVAVPPDAYATGMAPPSQPRPQTPPPPQPESSAGTQNGGLSQSHPSAPDGRSTGGGASAVRGTFLGASGPLVAGQAFGTRYHVIRMLGVGGMGAVYQAWDDELGVAVAIKVIRTEAVADPDLAEELQRRFKRELLLARQVTHKNVVRIHDLGEVDGIKYITMPYVQGSDVAGILKRQGKLSVARALAIARQVASGLQAAHEAGVVHRDLKPENIMIEGDLALIMDFGIARASAVDGTYSGMVVGTLGYMAPEQARAEPADQRADIYAFGLILYDMLLGRVRHTSGGQTTMAELMDRMQHAPRPARELDPDIPVEVDRILTRCVQPNPADRYQTTAELVHDLGQLDADGHAIAGSVVGRASSFRGVGPAPAAWRWPWRSSNRLNWLVPAAVAVGVAVIGVMTVVLLQNRASPPPSEEASAQADAAFLAILPFRNASGDPSLDWLGQSLSEILRTEVGQSASLRTIGSDRLQQLMSDLRILPGANLDSATLRRLAEFSNAQSVMWGQYLKFGDEIRIDATLEDLKAQRSIPLKAQAPNQEGLVATMGELARSVRESLASSTEDATDLSAISMTPSSKSLPALRYYNEGVSLGRQGKHSEALKQFEASTKEDPQFALAYSKLAETYKNLGYDNEAEQFSRKASGLSEALPAREKYFILAGHARILGDNPKAIESYESLLKASPDDMAAHFDLARLYEDTGSLDQAREHYVRVLKDDPKYVDALLATGRVEIRRGEPQAAIDYLNQALKLAIQFENTEARGNILNAMGIASKRLNKPEEALRYYQEALDIRRGLGQKGGMAASLSEIAQINATMGQPAEALKNHTAALELRREIGDKRGIGNTLLDLGSLHVNRSEYDQGLKLFRESLQIQREVGNKTYEALLLNNIGSVYFNQAQYDDAMTYFERALEIREGLKVSSDIAQTVHNLAEVNVKVGQYDKALTHYLRALDLSRTAGNKRAAAIDSYSVGTLFEYQGRYGAALSSKEEALKTFRELGESSFWMAEILSGYGNGLSQLGRFDEARRTLDEALTVARNLQNQVLVGQVLNFQGDGYFYAGDLTSARRVFDQALQAASRTTDRHLTLLTRVNLGKLDARERPEAAVASLTRLVQETDAEGLRYLSIVASVNLGEALYRLKRYDAAQQELERAVARSERLGLRALLASGHHLLGGVMRATGKTADAASHQANATRIVIEVQKEAGTEAIKKRADLARILAEGGA